MSSPKGSATSLATQWSDASAVPRTPKDRVSKQAFVYVNQLKFVGFTTVGVQASPLAGSVSGINRLSQETLRQPSQANFGRATHGKRSIPQAP